MSKVVGDNSLIQVKWASIRREPEFTMDY